MIEQAFHAYTKAVETKFELSRRPPTTKEGKVEWLNKEIQLRHRVDQLEKRPEFSALVRETLSAFRSDDWHSARGASWWRDPIRNFFCRTGYYTDTFAGSDAPCALFERYEAAFQRRSVHTKYMAPLEFVNFPKSELKFSGFEIRKFDRKELDEIAGNDVNRVFYPYAVLDRDTLDALQEYWFIVVKTEEEVRRLGWMTIAKEAVGWVSPEYTRFPTAIERALERLVLFDWVGELQEGREPPNGHWWFGFKIPFVLRVDDNDLKAPESAPDCSKLESYGIKHVDLDTDEEYKGHCVDFDLNESRVVAFEQCIKRADECLGHLEKKDSDTDPTYRDTYWPFLKVALGNVIKAFFTDGLEQLLWHITALEALLGERGSGITASLARRSTAILGTTEKERKECRKKFRELYDLRSALVHGRQFKEDVHRKQLFEARMMVLRVTIWFVHYLGEMAARIKEESWQGEVPDREDLLVLLDRRIGNADQKRLQAILNDLPTGFPAAPDWFL